jgi:hypothetical protein
MALFERAIGYGTHADRPAAGAPGALYCESDTGDIYRDSGTTWNLIVAAAGSGGLPLLDAVALTEAAPAITFMDILGTYSALQLHLEARGTFAGTSLSVRLRFNGDAGNNYDTQILDAYGSTAEAGEYFATPQILAVQIPGADSPANVAGGSRIDLPNYAGTTFEKRVQAHGGGKFGTFEEGMEVWLAQGYWRNTDAITAIELSPAADNFAIGTTARLYGVR